MRLSGGISDLRHDVNREIERMSPLSTFRHKFVRRWIGDVQFSCYPDRAAKQFTAFPNCKTGVLSILKQLTIARRPPVETDRRSGQKPAHCGGDRGDTYLQQKVKVIYHKRQCKTGSLTA
jgi:hypothetical protein